MKRSTYIWSLLVGCVAFATSCDLTEDVQVKADKSMIFGSKSGLELYSNSFYKALPTLKNGFMQDKMCDVGAVSNTDTFIKQGAYNTETATSWSWGALKNVNYFIDGCNDPKYCTVEAETRDNYLGIARWFRAWFYYDKLTTYGEVPWFPNDIQSYQNDVMYKDRDSRDVIIRNLIADLDFAYEHIQATSSTGSATLTRWAAAALKSRVCLYEGTFRKYHSREPSSDKPWQAEYNADNKFLREAAAAAKEIMDKGPYSLVTGDVKTAYRSLFTSAGLLTQEVIFGREYSKELLAFHETSWYYYSPTYGAKIAMTKKFMNTYLTTRGTPFTDIDGYQTIDFIREFDGRDARMAQTVISPTYKMKISGRERLYSPNWKVTRTGYHPIKWSIDDDADNVLSKAASWNSLPILRYAEVLLNYAEAKAELGEMDAAVWDQTIAQLRSRAGVTPVVPDKADPYMEAYFLNTVTDKWILEVRRERGIELCLEMGLRWDDDMRWHMGDLLTSDNNPWTGIWIGNTGYTYDFTGQSTDDNGDPVPDFYIRPGEDTEHSIAISNTGANQTFSLNAAGNIVWEYKRTWGEKKYLRPIPQTAITRNPNLEQNALWK